MIRATQPDSCIAPPSGLGSADRRHCMAIGLLMSLCPAAWSQTTVRTSERAAIRLPGDHGAHVQSAIEWWYLTGYLHSNTIPNAAATAVPRYGFQLTFFRARVPDTQNMRSAFAAKQLLFAHAALSDLTGQRLMHDQRIARLSGDPGVDLGMFSVQDTDLQLADWSLKRQANGYHAEFGSKRFTLKLHAQATQPILLQGDQGWSRKSRQAQHASHYYSWPQLEVEASLTLGSDRQVLSGRAWLDHEWSNALLAPDAVGWDWIGMNLHDGAALTAFRLRDRAGQAIWAGGSWRSPAGELTIFDASDVVFEQVRWWKSPHSEARYPVQWSLRLFRPEVPASQRVLQVSALMDDQELDSRRSTTTIYWEGLCRLSDDKARTLGYGYLEMTGYAAPLRLP